MKTFVAYRFTGEDPAVLEPLMIAVRDSLKAVGVDSYCTFFDEADFKNKDMNARQIMEHAFEIISNSDFLFVVQTSDAKSEGMLMEVGYCAAKQIPIVVATKDTVKYTYVPDMAQASFKWSDIKDLKAKVAGLDLEKLKVAA